MLAINGTHMAYMKAGNEPANKEEVSFKIVSQCGRLTYYKL